VRSASEIEWCLLRRDREVSRESRRWMKCSRVPASYDPSEDETEITFLYIPHALLQRLPRCSINLDEWQPVFQTNARQTAKRTLIWCAELSTKRPIARQAAIHTA